MSGERLVCEVTMPEETEVKQAQVADDDSGCPNCGSDDVVVLDNGNCRCNLCGEEW